MLAVMHPFPAKFSAPSFLASVSLAMMSTAVAARPVSDHTEAREISRISYGSCHRTGSGSARIFNVIRESKPELFLFLGDNIYGDSDDPAVLAAKYQALADIPEYAALKRETPILATWDDHDYGRNDAGAEFPIKKESAKLFLDFFDFPADHPARSREGVYHSAVFGEAPRRVQVILLDARYFRSPQRRDDATRSYLAENAPEATVLGEEQWKWLEAQLQVPAEVRILGSGIQVIPEEHRFEKWANFPRERERLLDMLAAAGGKIIILSGDRHMGEISRLEHNGRVLHEVTSSGMTHGGGGSANEPNRHRVGERFGPINFGTLEIDWQEDGAPLLHGVLRDVDGESVREIRY